MAAPAGNQFWKLRSKHGQDKLFTSPDILWEEACKYFQWCDENPWKKKDWVGKDALEVERETPRPYTLSGLCLFLDIDEQTLENYGTKDSYKEYFGVVTRIKRIVYTQKFEGAAVGFYNSNIIARDLGLRDKQEIDQTINIPAPIIILDSSEQED